MMRRMFSVRVEDEVIEGICLMLPPVSAQDLEEAILEALRQQAHTASQKGDEKSASLNSQGPAKEGAETYDERRAHVGAWPRSLQVAACTAPLHAPGFCGTLQLASVQPPSWLCPAAKCTYSEMCSENTDI